MELLDPKIDVVFKILLQHDLRLLRSMIEAVIHLPAPIEKLIVINPELPSNLAADKVIQLDIRIILINKCRIDLEMQCRILAFMAERFLFYWAREYASLLSRGNQYAKLVPVYSIIWFNDCLFKSDKFHCVFHISEDTTRELFSPHLELHTLELPKLGNLSPQTDPALHRWSRFLTAKSTAELEQLALEDPIMNLAKTALEQVSEDPKIQSLAHEREESLRLYEYTLDRTATESEARGEIRGRNEGRTEGRTEGLRTTLTRQLTKRYGAIPSWADERISLGTAEQLTAWLDALLDAASIEEALQTDA